MADRDTQYKLVGPIGVGGSFCGPYASNIPSCGSEHKPKLIVDETSAFAYAFVASDAFARQSARHCCVGETLIMRLFPILLQSEPMVGKVTNL